MSKIIEHILSLHPKANLPGARTAEKTRGIFAGVARPTSVRNATRSMTDGKA